MQRIDGATAVRGEAVDGGVVDIKLPSGETAQIEKSDTPLTDAAQIEKEAERLYTAWVNAYRAGPHDPGTLPVDWSELPDGMKADWRKAVKNNAKDVASRQEDNTTEDDRKHAAMMRIAGRLWDDDAALHESEWADLMDNERDAFMKAVIATTGEIAQVLGYEKRGADVKTAGTRVHTGQYPARMEDMPKLDDLPKMV